MACGVASHAIPLDRQRTAAKAFSKDIVGMLPGSLSSSRAGMLEATGADNARGLSTRLLACVTEAFPELTVMHSRVETRGGDHVLLIVNEAIVFRFPRSGMHDLSLEIAVLQVLPRRTKLRTPAYDYVDPAGRFAGYRFIDGVELAPRRFAALSEIARRHVLGEAARFLRDLHSLPIAAIAWSGPWPRAWTAAQFADRAINERIPLIVRHAPHLAEPLNRFYRLHRHDRAPRETIIHGDLVPEHILLDGSCNRLTGIIDFGDVALGDPAQDLLGFWSYGEHAVSRLIALYAPGETHPDLLARSRNHSIRYRIDQLFETLRRGESPASVRQTKKLWALLNRSSRRQATSNI